MDWIIICTSVIVILLSCLFWKYVKRRKKNVICDEEFNYWKIYLLCYKIGTESVRQFFHRQLPAPTLEAHLNAWQTRLDPIPTNRTRYKCHQTQFDLLFPTPPTKARSSTFDFTLLYKLIRNTFTLAYTWNQPLGSLGYTEMDDIERIHIYRNNIAHNTNLQISRKDSELQWKELSEAVSRLSQKTLQTEIEDLKKQTIDLKTRDELLEKMKTDFEYVRSEIEILQQESSNQRTKLGGINIKFQEHDTKFQDDDTKFKEHDTKLQEFDTSFQDHVTKFKNHDSKFDHHDLKFQDQDIKFQDYDSKLQDHDTKFHDQDTKFQDHNTLFQDHTTKIDDHATKLQKLESSVPPHVRNQAENILKTWIESDKVFCPDTRVYTTACYTVDSSKITAILGGPGAGKSATARHIALEYETKGWQVIPVTSLAEVLLYADPSTKQVFVIDDLFGVYSAEMSVYNSFHKCQDKLLNGQNELFKLILPSRKSVYNEVMGQCSFISVVDLNDEKIIYDVNEKRKILVKHCDSKDVRENVYNNLSLSTQFMFPFLCSQFVCNKNYQKCGERFFTNPHECLIEELDILNEHNEVQYAALILCLLNNNQLKDIKRLPEEQRKTVYDRCCKSTGITSKAITKALNNLTGVYVAQTCNQFSFIHDSIEEIVGYHFGQDNIDLVLKYMSSSFVFNMITVSKALKKSDLCIEVGEEDYQMLAERMYRDIKNKDSNQLFDVFRNRSVSYTPFAKTFMGIIKGLTNDGFEELFNVCKLSPNDIELRKESRVNNVGIILNTTCSGEIIFYNIRIISWILFYGHTNILNSILEYVKRNEKLLRQILGNQNEQQHLFILACLSGNIDTLKVLAQWIDKPDFNTTCPSFYTMNRYTPLTAVCTTGNVDIIKYLVSCGADKELLDGTNRYPLSVACSHEHLEVVKFLVENGVNVNKENCDNPPYDPPLHAVSFAGNVDIIRYLIEMGANIDLLGKFNASPLYCAASVGHIAAVKRLLDRGANIDLVNIDKETPLWRASTEGHIDVVRHLLDRGASVALSNIDNTTPLLTALEKEHFDIVRLLIEKKCCINLTNNRGESPLYYAVKHNKNEIVQMLINTGAILNMKGNNGVTPLMISLVMNNHEIVQTLVQAENFKAKSTNQQVEDKSLGMTYKLDNMAIPGNLHLFETVVELRGLKLHIDDTENNDFHFRNEERCLGCAVDSDIDRVTVQTVCKNVIKLGWDENNRNDQGESPLQVSCKLLLENRFHLWESTVNLIILLIENGANLNFRESYNEDLRDRVERWREIDKWRSEQHKWNLIIGSIYTTLRDFPRICQIRSFVDFLEVVSLVPKVKLNQILMDRCYSCTKVLKDEIRRKSL